MPINFETEAGYYDGSGIFHPNTYLLPTTIWGVSTTHPINPEQNYSVLPDVQPYVPYIYTPGYSADRVHNYYDSLTGQISQRMDQMSGAASDFNKGTQNAILLGIIALALVSGK